jgi:hypothetical protein
MLSSFSAACCFASSDTLDCGELIGYRSLTFSLLLVVNGTLEASSNVVGVLLGYSKRSKRATAGVTELTRHRD